jgi:agmatinase
MDAPPADGIYGLDTRPDDAGVILIPVPWEATTSYGRGTAGGPSAILEASKQVDLFDVTLAAVGLPDPSAAGIAMLQPASETVAAASEAAACASRVIARYDAGDAVGADHPDLRRVNELSAELNERVAAVADSWRSRGKLVGVVGGDHSVAYGAIAAAAARHPGLGVLQIDAHADLRVAYQGFTDSHASVMHNVMQKVDGVAKLVSVGVRDFCSEEHDAIVASDGRIQAFFDADCARRQLAGTRWQTLCAEVADALPDEIYVSFDIDGLDPTLCPSTGTPVPGGLSFHEAVFLLSVLAANKTIVGFDLCEVAPGRDEWDANVGARMLYQLIGHALAST